jgi:uncharacterized membrane protein
MQSERSTLDRFIGRALGVDMTPSTDTVEQQTRTAENAFGLSLMFSGVRCILQYAVLPFLLPLVGIATEAATPLLMIISVLAMISIVFSLRRFWRIGYKYRWQYLVVAVTALTLLAAFLVFDLINLGAVCLGTGHSRTETGQLIVATARVIVVGGRIRFFDQVGFQHSLDSAVQCARSHLNLAICDRAHILHDGVAVLLFAAQCQQDVKHGGRERQQVIGK